MGGEIDRDPPAGIEWFSRAVLGRPLRPYQLAVARAVVASVLARQGLTFTVMMARQMGKNELSAQLECFLLNVFRYRGGQIVKCAPTFRPQAIISQQRLERLLQNPLNAGKWCREHGYMLRLDQARVLFFSAAEHANVVGATADLLLEIDEAQDVDPEKYARDFRPMGATANVTTVLYGTAWTNDTLLEQQRQLNLAAERQDGIRRHFEFDWRHGARANPLYGRYVEAEIARLGAEHPIIRTQYRLEALDAGNRFFSPAQRLLLQGTHPRCRTPREGAAYIAGIDVAGALEAAATGPPESTTDAAFPGGAHGRAPLHAGTGLPGNAADAALRALQPRKDSTVCGIAELTYDAEGQPQLKLVEIFWWTGRSLADQCSALIRLLRDAWQCRKVVVDASGIGADLAARLRRALGPAVVEPVVFSAAVKSQLAYHLLALVNAGWLRVWAPDGSPEHAELFAQVERCRYELRAHQQMSFFVPPDQGHDDFVTMLALLAWSTTLAAPPAVSVFIPPRPDDLRGRY
jgi:hypothetical protein